MADTSQNDTIPNGEEIVERFGGIRPMAAKLDIAVTTVQGWKKRDAIPMSRRDEILSAAAEYGVNLRGLISGSVANQNAGQNAGQSTPRSAPASTIAEDPALTRAAAATPVAPAAKPAHQRPAAPRAPEHDFVDLKRVRRTATRTSFITTTCLLALIGGAGYLLFGGALPTSTNTSALESRVTTIEQQLAQAPAQDASILQQLRTQVQSMTDAFGVQADDFTAMAQGVRNGNVTPILQRLATLEQSFAQSGNNQSLQGMVQRMENVLSNPQGNAQWDATIAELRRVVNGLQGRVDTLDGALQEVQTENSNLAYSLTDVSGRDLGAAAMLLALTQVRYMVDRQAPFEDDLALLQNVAGDNPELNASIERLAPYAASGVLSSEGLKRELQGLSNDIINAKLRGENLSFKERAMARINNLFSLTKDGTPVTGGSERDLIAQATAQLDAGDVEGAMATLQRLEGPAAAAAAPWQQQAAATVAVESIDRQLVNTLIGKLRNAGSGAQAPINLAPRRQVQQAPAQTDAQPPVQAPAQNPAPYQNQYQDAPDSIVIEQ